MAEEGVGGGGGSHEIVHGTDSRESAFLHHDISSIDVRKNSFAQSLQPYLDTYGKEMLNEFYLYWTEPNQQNTKMKFELERTYSLERRLNTWSKQSVKFGTAISKAETPKFNPYG